jgi:hypothetical protein
VNLSKETVRLPLYPGIAYAGTPRAEKVWYILEDASDPGLAHDLGVNYAPKLANIAIGDPAAVQTVTLTNPSPAANPFGPGVVNFAGAPDFAPTRVAVPGPNGFPLAKFAPGSVAGPGYSPFIRRFHLACVGASSGSLARGRALVLQVLPQGVQRVVQPRPRRAARDPTAAGRPPPWIRPGRRSPPAPSSAQETDDEGIAKELPVQDLAQS